MSTDPWSATSSAYPHCSIFSILPTATLHLADRKRNRQNGHSQNYLCDLSHTIQPLTTSPEHAKPIPTKLVGKATPQNKNRQIRHATNTPNVRNAHHHGSRFPNMPTLWDIIVFIVLCRDKSDISPTIVRCPIVGQDGSIVNVNTFTMSDPGVFIK